MKTLDMEKKVVVSDLMIPKMKNRITADGVKKVVSSVEKAKIIHFTTGGNIFRLTNDKKVYWVCIHNKLHTVATLDMKKDKKNFEHECDGCCKEKIKNHDL